MKNFFKIFQFLIICYSLCSSIEALALEKFEKDFLVMFKVQNQQTKDRLSEIKKYVLKRKEDLLKRDPKTVNFILEEIDIDLYLIRKNFNPYKMTRKEKVRAYNLVKKLVKKKKSKN